MILNPFTAPVYTRLINIDNSFVSGIFDKALFINGDSWSQLSLIFLKNIYEEDKEEEEADSNDLDIKLLFNLILQLNSVKNNKSGINNIYYIEKNLQLVINNYFQTLKGLDEKVYNRLKYVKDKIENNSYKNIGLDNFNIILSNRDTLKLRNIEKEYFKAEKLNIYENFKNKYKGINIKKNNISLREIQGILYFNKFTESLCKDINIFSFNKSLYELGNRENIIINRINNISALNEHIIEKHLKAIEEVQNKIDKNNGFRVFSNIVFKNINTNSEKLIDTEILADIKKYKEILIKEIKNIKNVQEENNIENLLRMRDLYIKEPSEFLEIENYMKSYSVQDSLVKNNTAVQSNSIIKNTANTIEKDLKVIHMFLNHINNYKFKNIYKLNELYLKNRKLLDISLIEENLKRLLINKISSLAEISHFNTLNEISKLEDLYIKDQSNLNSLINKEIDINYDINFRKRLNTEEIFNLEKLNIINKKNIENEISYFKQELKQYLEEQRLTQVRIQSSKEILEENLISAKKDLILNHNYINLLENEKEVNLNEFTLGGLRSEIKNINEFNKVLNKDITSHSLNRIYTKSNILRSNTINISEKIIEKNLKVIEDVQNRIDKNNGFRVFSNIVFKNINNNSEKLIDTEILTNIKRYKEILIKEIKNIKNAQEENYIENLLRMRNLYFKEHYEFLQIEDYMKSYDEQDSLVKNNTLIQSNSIIESTANTIVKDLRASDIFLNKIYHHKLQNIYKLNELYLKNKKVLEITLREENLKRLLINEISDSSKISYLNILKENSKLENLYIKDEINLNKVINKDINMDYDITLRKKLNTSEILNLEKLNVINKKNIENEINYFKQELKEYVETQRLTQIRSQSSQEIIEENLISKNKSLVLNHNFINLLENEIEVSLSEFNVSGFRNEIKNVKKFDKVSNEITSHSLSSLCILKNKYNILKSNTSNISEKIIEKNLKVIEDFQNKIDKNNSFKVFSNIIFKNINNNTEKLIDTEVITDIKKYKEILIKEIKNIKNIQEENYIENLRMKNLFIKEHADLLEIENYIKQQLKEYFETHRLTQFRRQGSKEIIEENLISKGKNLLLNHNFINLLENEHEVNLNGFTVSGFRNEIKNINKFSKVLKEEITSPSLNRLYSKSNILGNNTSIISEKIIENNLKVIEDIQNKIDKNNNFRVFSNIVFKNISSNSEKLINTEILTDIKRYKEILIKEIKNVQEENLLKMADLYTKEYHEFLQIENYMKSYAVQDSLVKNNTAVQSNSIIENTVNKTVKDLNVSDVFLNQINNYKFKNIYKLNELYLKNRKLLDITFREENLKRLLINEILNSAEILHFNTLKEISKLKNLYIKNEINLNKEIDTDYNINFRKTLNRAEILNLQELNIINKKNIENEINYFKQELNEYLETQKLTQFIIQGSKQILDENLIYKNKSLILNHDFINLLENEMEVNLNKFTISGFTNEIKNINDFNKVLSENITSYSLNRLYNKSNILKSDRSSISEKIIEKNLKVIEDVQNKIDKNNGFRVFSNILFKNINNNAEKLIDTEILTDIKRYKEILIEEIKNIKNVQEENHIENLLKMRNLYFKEHHEFVEIRKYEKSYALRDSLVENNNTIQSNSIIENNVNIKGLKVSDVFLYQIHNFKFKNIYKLNKLYLKNRKLLDITFEEENLKSLLINEISNSVEISHLNTSKQISKLEKLNIINKKNIENEINYFKQELKEYFETQRLIQFRNQGSKEILEENLTSKNKRLILNHNFINLLENKRKVNLDEFTISGFRNEIKNISDFNKISNVNITSNLLNRLYNKSHILISNISSISEKIIEKNLKVMEDVQNKIDKNNGFRVFSKILFKNISNIAEKLIDTEILTDIKIYKETLIKEIKNIQEENLKTLLINEISNSAEISHLNILKEISKLENLHIKDEINLNKIINKEINTDYDINLRKRLNTTEIFNLEKLNVINKKNIENEINYFKQELKEYIETEILTQVRSQASKEIIEENLISNNKSLILNHEFINLLENKIKVNLDKFTISGFRNEIKNINGFNKVLNDDITSYSLNRLYNKSNILRSNTSSISEKIIEKNLKVIEDVQNKIDKNNVSREFSNIVFKNINNTGEKLTDLNEMYFIQKTSNFQGENYLSESKNPLYTSDIDLKYKKIETVNDYEQARSEPKGTEVEFDEKAMYKVINNTVETLLEEKFSQINQNNIDEEEQINNLSKKVMAKIEKSLSYEKRRIGLM